MLLNDSAVWLSLLQVFVRGSCRLSFTASHSVNPGWTVALHSGWVAARRRRSEIIIAAGPSVVKRSLVFFFWGEMVCYSWAAVLGLLRLAPVTVARCSVKTHATFLLFLMRVSFVM